MCLVLLLFQSVCHAPNKEVKRRVHFKDLEALFLIHWHIVSMENGRPMVHIQLATDVPISGTYQCFVLWMHVPEDQSKSKEMIHTCIYMLNYLWLRTHG